MDNWPTYYRTQVIDLIVSEDSEFTPCDAETILYKYKADIPFEAGFEGENNA
jgi:hypothetical protein